MLGVWGMRLGQDELFQVWVCESWVPVRFFPGLNDDNDEWTCSSKTGRRGKPVFFMPRATWNCNRGAHHQDCFLDELAELFCHPFAAMEMIHEVLEAGLRLSFATSAVQSSTISP